MSLRYMFHWQVTYLLSIGTALFFVIKSLLWDVQVFPRRYIKLFAPPLFIIAIVSSIDVHQHQVMSNKIYNSSPLHPDDVGHQIYLSSHQNQKICETIYDQTGWDADQILRRVFMIRLDNGADLWSICNDTLSKRRSQPQSQLSTFHPDGYFLFRHVGTYESPDLWKTWWITQVLPAEFSHAIDSHQIVFDSPLYVAGMILLPYKGLNPFALPKEAFNLGYGYKEAPGENILLQTPMIKRRGSYVDANGKNIVFYINDCTPQQKWCRVAIILSGDSNQLKTSKSFKVDILGTPLSQRAWYLHQYLSMALYEVHLNIHCDQNIFAIPVVSQIGNFLIEESRESRFFTTPYSRLLPLKCSSPINSVELSIKKLKSFNSVSHKSEDNLRMKILL